MHNRTIYEYFSAVAEELSFTAAAARLNVAQPWLSSRIRQLEQTLGYALFVRTTRRVELTEEGKALLPRAQDIARAMSAFDEAASALAAKSEPLRIGVPLYAGRIPMVRQVLDGLGKGRSPIAYDIDIAWTRQLIEQLGQGELDAVIVLAPQHNDAFDVLVLEETRLEIEMDARDPLATAPLTIAALAGRSIEVFSRKPNPWLFDALYGALQNGGAKLVQSDNLWSLKTKRICDKGAVVAGTRALWDRPPATGRIRRVPDESPSVAICLLKRRDANGAGLNRLWEIATSAA